MSIRTLLSDRVHSAMIKAGIPQECSPSVSLSSREGFGDYQANGAMASAKMMKRPPRDVAQAIVAQLDLDGIAEKVEIAGPGFINIHLDNGFLAKAVVLQGIEVSLPQRQTDNPQTIVVDYSSPNLAKEMHVGHLRSTIIGDALVRTLEYLGHNVIRQNHMGDWGTQFGMLIAELEEHLGEGEKPEMALKDLETFYQQAKKHFDDDAAFADKARAYVVKLQSGDEHCLALWQQFITISVAHSEEIYRLLNVSLSHTDIKPESAYNDDLQTVVQDLKNLGLCREDQGAQVVFLEELADKQGNPSPMIIQKSGGGFLYATTDLAALRYRANTLKADRILYFIDARQALHMQQVFTLARKAGFVAQNHPSLEHHAFGTMMGSDGKPFKTRSGGTVKLEDLIHEAIDRAGKLIAERDSSLTPEQQAEIARKVGIGAIKYADLCKTRTNDYVFNWDTMLSFEGNTAPYLQYAYTRIHSIFRKFGTDIDARASDIQIEASQEKALALKLLQFEDCIAQVAEEAFPHVLCNYLYDLASAFMSFYEHCPILKDGVEQSTRDSRLHIAHITQETISRGLTLLGIEVMEKM
jgi:arginyl-tRNA synthetase